MNSPALPEKTVLGSCEIRAVLGQGGGGISYLAYDRALEREVVIKEHFPMGLCMRAAGSSEVEPMDEILYPRSLATFCREARILAGLNHPNVVKIYDIFEGSGTAYLVMEYVEGSTLRTRMPQIADNAAAVQTILEQLLHTLHYLHGNSIIHRDIKPSNLIIRDDGQPTIIDFGSAHLGTANHTLTPVGSPGYAAPEQFSPNGRVGAWSDLYALAQSFLHLLPRESKKCYPRRFLKTLRKAAAPEVADRYVSAQEWLQELRTPTRNKTLFFLPASLLLGGIIGGLSLQTLHHEKQADNRQPNNTYNIPPSASITTENIPECIILEDGTVIYDSSGQNGSNSPAIKEQAGRIYEQYWQDLIHYLKEAQKQQIPGEQQNQAREKLLKELEQKLRGLLNETK